MIDKQAAESYQSELLLALIETQSEMNGEGLIPPVFGVWITLVSKLCEKRRKEYLSGKSETFKLDQDELKETYEEALTSWVDEGITAMVKKGVLEVAVDKDGEMVYGLSDKGRKVAEELKKEKDGE